jgi:histidyl-tRNA synthetase
MEILEMVESASTPAEVFIPLFDASRLGDYLAIARTLRAEGLRVEVFPEAKAIGKQLKYANKRGHKVAVIAGEDEFAKGLWQVKNLQVRGDQSDVATGDLAEHLRTIFQT